MHATPIIAVTSTSIPPPLPDVPPPNKDRDRFRIFLVPPLNKGDDTLCMFVRFFNISFVESFFRLDILDIKFIFVFAASITIFSICCIILIDSIKALLFESEFFIIGICIDIVLRILLISELKLSTEVIIPNRV